MLHFKVDAYKAVDASAILSAKKSHTSIFRGDQEINKVICDHCGDKGHTIERCFKLHGFPSSKVICDHCGDKGYAIEKCFRLHGFPPGWKKGRKSQPWGVQGANWNRAHHTASEKELPIVDTQALDKYSSKLKLFEGPSSTQSFSTNFSYHATSEGINLFKPMYINLG